MKSKNGWMIVIVFGLAVLFFLPALCGYGYLGRHGYGMMGDYGMMYDIFPFDWIWTWIFPLLMLVGCVVCLVSYLGGACKTGPAHICAHCGKSSQAEWKTCPFCGKSL